MKKIAFVVVAVILLASQVYASTCSMTWSWDAPTTRVDNSTFSLSEISAYVLVYDTNPNPTANTLNLPITVSWPSQAHMTTVVSGLTCSTPYYAKVAVKDQYGQQSAFSITATGSTGLPAAPSAPVSLAGQQVTGGQII